VLGSFHEIFHSYYLPRTYCFIEDPLEDWIENYSFERHHPELVAPLTEVLLKAKVSSIFNEPISYDADKILRNTHELQQNNFKLLGSRPAISGFSQPYYSAVEHPKLPDWVLKPSGERIPRSTFIYGPKNPLSEMAYFNPNDGLYRIPMRERIQRIADEENIPLVLPKKFYAKIPFSNRENKRENYFVIAEKISILAIEETFQRIKAMDSGKQSLIAYQMGQIIRKSGFLDATLNNIRLTQEGKIAIIDTEPAGFLRERTLSWSFPWTRYGYHGTLEKSARIGLHILRAEFCIKKGSALGKEEPEIAIQGFESFKEMLDLMILEDRSLDISFNQKVISVLSLGVIPLLRAIQAIFTSLILDYLRTLIDTTKDKYLKKSHYHRTLPYAEKKAKELQYRKKMNLWMRMLHFLQSETPKIKRKKVELEEPFGAYC